MPRSHSIVKSISLTAMIFAGAGATADDHDNSLKAHVAEIMEWWDGDYNNDEQLAALEALNKPVWREDGSGEGGHIEVTSHYRPVDLPAFGPNVIYVEETKHGDPNNIFRQRIYTLTPDEEIGKVRVKLWYFKDKEKYVGAWKDMTRVASLTPEDMFPLQDECDLLAEKQGKKYHMPMPERDCVFGERYFSYQVLLGPDSFWFRDKIVNLKDETQVESAGAYTYHELNRVE